MAHKIKRCLTRPAVCLLLYEITRIRISKNKFDAAFATRMRAATVAGGFHVVTSNSLPKEI